MYNIFTLWLFESLNCLAVLAGLMAFMLSAGLFIMYNIGTRSLSPITKPFIFIICICIVIACFSPGYTITNHIKDNLNLSESSTNEVIENGELSN